MTVAERELENRLMALPDVYPGFVRASLQSIGQCGLVDEVLCLLDEMPDATTDSVLVYESLRCGLVDRFSDDGARMPVPCEWLALTPGMRGILAEMRGKTLKSYQLAVAGGGGLLADRSVRLNLGQHAVDLNCCDFTFEVGGRPAELAALLCERMSLNDDFGPDADAPVRAYAVGERITGVELVSDRVELEGGEALGIDVAVAVRTAYAVYTFARESWASTRICVAVADAISIPPSADGLNAERLAAQPELGGAKVERSTRKLA